MKRSVSKFELKSTFLHLFLYSGVICLLLSCGASKTATTTSPIVKRTLPPLPQSKIYLPVKIYLKPLLAKMDSSTSKEFTSENWPQFFQSACDFRYMYRFVRSPFTFSIQNNAVNIGFRGYYQIAGSKSLCAFNKQIAPWVTGSCGFGDESLRRVDVNINSQLQFLPNHQIRTNTTVNRIRPIDKCQVTLMQSDITQQIMDSIRSSIEVYSREFDRFVFQFNNNPVLQDWRKGPKVLPLATYGFINLNPVQLNITPFTYSKDTLAFALSYTGRPIFSSDSTRLVSNTRLPQITNVPTAGNVETYIDAVYDFTYFNKILNDSLANKPFTVEGRTFVIKDVTLSGSDDGKVKVDLGFTGFKTGRLVLEGTPVLDSTNQVLSMPDIRFSLDSRDMLLNMAKGLFRKRIMKELRNQSVFDFGELIRRNQSQISSRLNQRMNDWVSTRGNLQELRIIGMLITGEHLQLQLAMRGNLELVGHPPPGMSF